MPARESLAALAALAGALSVSAPMHAAVPTDWTFRVAFAEGAGNVQARGVPASGYINGGPVIDEDGSVIVRWTAFSSGANGILRFDAATGNAVEVVPDPLADTNTTTDYDIRNRRIAVKWFDGVVRVYDFNGLPLREVTNADGPLAPRSSVARPTLHAGGALGYRASVAGVPTLIVDSLAGPARTQDVAAQQLPPVTFLSATVMNQAFQFGGTVFQADPSGATDRTVQRLQAGQPPVTLFSALTSGYADVANQTDINDAGQVSFFARRTDGVWELRKGTGAGTSVLLAASDDPQLSPAAFINFQPDLANNGLVAFRSSVSAASGGGFAVFVTDGTALHRVAGVGDSVTVDVEGTPTVYTLASVEPFAPSQNEANQIAFSANVAGSNATLVLVATPVPSTACRADFDGRNGADLLDIFAFLEAWFNGCTGPGSPVPACPATADYDGRNGVDLLDIFAFLTDWFAGC